NNQKRMRTVAPIPGPAARLRIDAYTKTAAPSKSPFAAGRPGTAEARGEPRELLADHCVDRRRERGDGAARVAADYVVPDDPRARSRRLDRHRQRPAQRLGLERPECA